MKYSAIFKNSLKRRFIILLIILLSSIFTINLMSIPQIYIKTGSTISKPEDISNIPLKVSEFNNNHSIMGQGDKLKSIITSNATYNMMGKIEDIENDPEREYSFTIDNHNWNLTRNNFTVDNIKANSTYYIVDNYPTKIIENDFFNMYIWMSIKIPVSCIVNEVLIFVQEINISGPEWTIVSYNATRDPVTFLVTPDSPIALLSQKIAYDPNLPDDNQKRAAHWESFECDNTNANAILNINNTYRDTYGNGYYFICVIMPRKTNIFDSRYTYINLDENDIDNGYLYAGVPGNIQALKADLCMIVDISPINNRPRPTDIGLGVENKFRPDPRIDIIENETSQEVGYIYNTTFENKIIAQNFTFDQEGVLNNISLYLKFNNSNLYENVIYLGIVADKGYGFPVIDEDNPVIDVGVAFFQSTGLTEQWVTFIMFEQPRLKKGMYWWLLFANTTAGTNITAMGYDDTNGDSAVALNGTIFSNSTVDWDLINYDFACKIGWHPGKEVLPFKDITFSSTNLTIESQYVNKTNALRNITGTYGRYVVAAQNFTVPGKGGLLKNITLRLKSTYKYVVLQLIIYPDNGTGNGPDLWNPVMYTITWIMTTNETWQVFEFNYSNGIDGGMYWWMLIAYTNTTDPQNNVTIYGIGDSINGNNAIALNGSALDMVWYFNELPVDYACIIGWERTPKGLWFNDTRLYPSKDGLYHYKIKSRWMGEVSFELRVENTIESYQYIDSSYTYDYNTNRFIQWNISTELTIPSGFEESTLNIFKPYDWKVMNVKKGASDYTNYQVNPNNKSLLIWGIENGSWSVYFRSINYQGNITIFKKVGLNYIAVSEIQIYDNITINVSIAGQKSGIVRLGIYYPYPNNFTHYEDLGYLDINGNATFTWKPELDPLAIGGTYSIVSEWNNGTEASFLSTTLIILPNPTNLSIFENMSRFPYIDDATQTLIIKFNDSIRGYGIEGAIIKANIIGIKNKSLEWDDLYSLTQNISKKGFYKIKIDTTGLPINDSYKISIQASKIGYCTGILQNITLKIKPVPVTLTSDINTITQYIDEDISFKCSFKDTFHSIDIDWATMRYKIINTSIEGLMSLSMPGESIYESGAITLTDVNITGNKQFKINITATAENCSSASILINLTVKAKTQTEIRLNPSYPIPKELIEGQSLTLSVFLINKSSGLGISNKTIVFSFGGKISQRIANTDDNGMALIEIVIPNGIDSLDVFIEFEGSIESYNTAYSSPITINIISRWEYIGRILLWIVIGVAAVVSVLLVHKYAIAKPRKARKIKRLTKIANKFRDIANLQFLMVIHKQAGASIFNYAMGETEFDPVLVSGFFTAIGAFETELSKKHEKEEVGRGFELSYSKYKILVMDGELVKCALITEFVPSQEIRQQLQEFLERFEQVYRNELINFRGNVNVFKTAGDLVKDCFELELTYPQVFTDAGLRYLELIKKNKPIKDLTKLEIALIKIMDSIMKTRGTNYFFMPLVISMAQAARPEQDVEIIGALYNLYQRKIITPVEFK
ncbi:MAG: hypothetical protein ACTSRP_08020 [Candidatus Helarchaeota archaeon]